VTPAKDASGPVAVAVYAALNVASLTALATGGVFDMDDVPQSSTTPYVGIEVVDEQSGEMDTMGKHGAEVLVHVHAFSRYEGGKEAQAIVGKAKELLDYQALTVAGWTFEACQWRRSFRVDDEIIAGLRTQHRVAEFNVRVFEA